MRDLAASILVGLLAATSPCRADGPPAGTASVASRTFLVGEAPDETTRVEDFLPLTSVPWLWRLIQDDPLLDGAVVHVRQRPSPPSVLLGPDSDYARRYTDLDRVPAVLRAEGYVSATSERDGVPTQFLIRPDRPEPDFQMRCGTLDPLSPDFRFNVCLVSATYPRDPAISVEARLYFPPPFADLAPRLEAIVGRMREIALCLDVTEAPPADPPAALAALLAANPRLEGCTDGLSS